MSLKVNGVRVHSNKAVRGISNSRVTFADGSWCDVRTGQVTNVGAGFITLGGATTTGGSSAPATVGPKRVTARTLEVRAISADVRVVVHDAPDMEYTITGPENDVNSVRADVRAGTLVISSDYGDSVGVSGGDVVSQSVAMGGVISRFVSFIRNLFGLGNAVDLIRSGNFNVSAFKITIKVPRGASVNVNRVDGDVVIGDTDGPLIASVNNSGVTAGRVTSANLSVLGNGGLRVNQVDGPVWAAVRGNGTVEIVRGTMPTLTAKVQGNGRISVGGSAVTANLSVVGNGDIDVAHVFEHPAKKVVGNGDIHVRRIG